MAGASLPRDNGDLPPLMQGSGRWVVGEITVGHLNSPPSRITEVPPEPTRTGNSCTQTKNRNVRHVYVGRVMSAGRPILSIGPTDVGPYGHYVGQVT